MSTVRIGYMGVKGSFSEKAAKAFMKQYMPDTECELEPLVKAAQVRDALSADQIDFGVVAIHNTSSGDVKETEDAFREKKPAILGEYALPVHQCLFKLPGTPVDEIVAVASHPQALMQTHITRSHLFPDMKEIIAEDTSLSARKLASGAFPENYAVVCSQEAGQMNGLDLVCENIEDKPDNKTIFQLIALNHNTYPIH